MKLGLYFNCLLTSQAAWNPEASQIPVYPRLKNWRDAGRKIEICKASIHSMRHLPVAKIILNVEGVEEFSQASKQIEIFTRKTFPTAEILSNSTRPSSLDSWRQDTAIVKSFFGDSCPIICAFNHDHIFVDYLTNPILEQIQASFNGDLTRPRFLYYSHFPEIFSIIHSTKSASDAFTYLSPAGKWFDAITKGPGNGFTTKSPGMIHGYFVTNYAGLDYIWSNAVTSVEYVPRPDWSTVSYPNTVFECILPSREFFRHFDGYGHMSISSNGLALSLNDCETISIPPLAETKEPRTLTQTDCDSLTNFYYKKFFDISTIALRNGMYSSLKSQSPWHGRAVIESLIKIFSKGYLDVDSHYFNFSNEFVQDLKMALGNIALVNSPSQLAEAFNDILFNRVDLFPKPKDPLAYRAIRRLSRIAKRFTSFTDKSSDLKR